MSIEVMNAVWRHSKSDGRARLVLLAIADHQGEIGAWPSIQTLAKMVNASERSVQRDIQYLVSIGELSVSVQNAPTGGQYKSNLYWVTLSGVTNAASGVTNAASGVTAGGVLTLNRTITEDIESVKELFDEFWKEYPKKSDKRAALKAFRSALTRETFENILAGAIRYATDPNLPESQYIKHASTWLNADAWENPPLPARKVPKQNAKEDEKRRLEEWIKQYEEDAN